MRRPLLLAVTLVLTGALSAHGDGMPRKRGPLLAWLKAGRYADTFTCEPAARASHTVHGAYVRTCYNPALVQALRGGALPFPKGVAMVKELYGNGTATIEGYSTMAKVRRRSGAGGQGWFWFETLDARNPIASGRGVPVCAGCHVQGVDFLQSSFRP